MNKQKIFEYMEWELLHNSFMPADMAHPLDANDMIAAVNKMVEKEELKQFFIFADSIQDENVPITTDLDYYIYLFTQIMQPTRFFTLMSDWLERK